MKYLLLLKAADAELRAWRNLSDERKRNVNVHCELTRGRKKKTKPGQPQVEYNIDGIFKSLEEDFSICNMLAVDITREPTLSSSETIALSSSKDGYANWVKKIGDLHQKNHLVRPTLLINPEAGSSFDQYKDDVFSQFDAFAKDYDHITYRVSVLHDPDFLMDVDLLSSRINSYTERGNTFRILFDFEYITPSTALIQASYAAELVRAVLLLTPNVEIYSVGTSFPKNVTQVGHERTDEFRLNEITLNREINRLQNVEVGYGDYGSINPERNDSLGGPGIHMRARVDFPTAANTVYYHRVDPTIDKDSNTLLSPRSIMYKQAARLVVEDARFSSIPESWGFQKVEEAARSLPEGSSPSFWISARMEMHICRQLDRIKSELPLVS